jgi:hypothetical protein
VTTVPDVLHARLATQRMLSDPLAGSAEVVALLAAVQSQEFAHALWSLRLRSASGTEAEVRAAFDRGEFLRTHVLRPTWHLVAAEDIGWLLAVTAPRVQRLNGTMYRQQGLDQAALDRAATTITDALAGGAEFTRADLGALLGTSGVRLAYQVMNAELEGLIVSGAMRGAQHTYARLADRVPAARRRSGDLAELAFRFYAGHGPASEPDLARWATLTRRQAAEASRGPADLAGGRRGAAVAHPGRSGATGGPDVRGAAAAALRRADAQLSDAHLPGGRGAAPSGRGGSVCGICGGR